MLLDWNFTQHCWLSHPHSAHLYNTEPQSRKAWQFTCAGLLCSLLASFVTSPCGSPTSCFRVNRLCAKITRYVNTPSKPVLRFCRRTPSSCFQYCVSEAFRPRGPHNVQLSTQGLRMRTCAIPSFFTWSARTASLHLYSLQVSEVV